MPHHGNEEEHNSSASREAEERQAGGHQEPVIRDNRKVDPVTGAARHPEGEHHAEASPLAATKLLTRTSSTPRSLTKKRRSNHAASR